MNRSLSKLGERKIINELRTEIAPCKNNLLGTEDDSAIYDMGLEKYLVVHTDRIPFSYGIRYGIVDFYGFGKYFAGAVTNDVIAKGGKPFGLLVALGLPLETRLTDLHSFYKGINNVLQKYAISIIGGDTKQSSNLDVVGTAMGLVDKDYFISRRGALEGDIVAITGPVGLFAANVYSALVKDKIPRKLIRELKVAYNASLRIPYEIMDVITSLKSANASIDISDGLWGDLNKIAGLSGVGIEIDHSKIPFHNIVRNLSSIMNLDPTKFARIGGDLQIALTISREKWEVTLERLGTQNVRLYEIGKVIKGSGITICYNDERRVMRNVPEWEWFKGLTMEELLLD